MNIYFAASIRGGRDDQELYFSIIEELAKYGTVLTEHIGKRDLGIQGEISLSDKQIFERDMKMIKEADLVVAEVTTPSLGVGYELGQALALNKKVLCLYREQDGKLVSAMISGNSYMKVFKYNSIEDVKEILSKNLS